MNIYLVRHGQTNWNIQNKLQGSADIPLNNTGIEQANMLKNILKGISVDFIISSPLKRALTTAEIINSDLHLPLYMDEALKERSFGELEGVHGGEYDKELFWDYYKNHEYKNVEKIQDFFTRIFNFLDNLQKKYADKSILIVTHNGVNIAANCYFNGFDKDTKLLDIKLDNCNYVKYESPIDRYVDKDR